jgi:NTE family protein
MSQPTVGLVLSGGGARGIAHIGAIKALQEAGIHPDYISGASAGAIVGAFYAASYSCEEMLTFF